MNQYSDLANLKAHQLKLLKKKYGMTMGELEFLEDFHKRYSKTGKSLIKRLL